MGAYTPEQFQKLAGGEIKVLSNQAPETVQPEKKGWFTRIKEDLIQRGQNIAQGFNTNQNIGSAVLQGVGQVAAGAGDIAGETIKSVGDVTGATEALKPVGVAILNTPVGQAGVQAIQGGLKSWEDFKTKEPETAKNIEAVLNIASVLPIGKGAELTGKAVKGGAEMAVETGAKVGAKAKKAVGLAELTPEQRIAKAIEAATPDYESLTPARKRKFDLNKVEEGGILEGRKAQPNKLETAAGQELAQIPEFNPQATALEQWKVADKARKQYADTLDANLKAEKVMIPKKEMKSAINEVLIQAPKESLILQSTDPTIKRYRVVVENAMKNIPGTTEGINNLRKLLDEAYENAGGSYGLKTDRQMAIDVIHRPMRKKLDSIFKKYTDPKNYELKTKQSRLYNAQKVLKEKVSKEAGSKLGRLAQKFPKVTKAVKSVGGGLGIGTAVNLAD